MAKHKCDHYLHCPNNAITHIEVPPMPDQWFCYPHFLSFIGYLVRAALKHPEYSQYVASGIDEAEMDAVMEEIEKQEREET